ncbi:MAG: O-methyltransferase [Tepidisphaeraceae bacterium]
MNAFGRSLGRVRYDLRPAKQVERMMLIDGLQLLATSGFSIPDYRYVGMGSIHFYDYSLFYKFLGIERLLSVEINKTTERRIRFNKPLGLVDIFMGSIGEVIPTLSADERHLLWLDYDGPLSSALLADAQQAAALLSIGSILLLTIDVEPPRGGAKPSAIRELYRAEAGTALPEDLPITAFRAQSLHVPISATIDRTIQRGLAGRRNVSFAPMFNFLYGDGHRMLTVGGMIVSPEERRKIDSSLLVQRNFYRNSLTVSPFEIVVPTITRREKLYLDQFMPANADWRPKHFDLPEDDLRAYREIFRFNPLYSELIL